MKHYLLTISILFLSFSASISFAADDESDVASTKDAKLKPGDVAVTLSAPNTVVDDDKAVDNTDVSYTKLTEKEREFLGEAEKLAKTSKAPANSLISFMKNNSLPSSVAKKLRDVLERFQYKVSDTPSGGVGISYNKDDNIQAYDSTNTKYKIINKQKKKADDNCNGACLCHSTCLPNDDIALRIQNLDKTIRLVSSDIGLLNDSIISTKIKLDGIVHNLNNIIGYIQMTDGYKWQSFLQNVHIEQNSQPPKEYILSMDNLSKTLSDVSVVLKQAIEQKSNIQHQVIQQPCQQASQPQYVDSLNKTISELSIMLQQALKRDDAQDKPKCQSCLINEQINKVNDDKISRDYIESIESLNKTLLSLSEKLNNVVNHQHNHEKELISDENKRLEQDRISTLASLNAALINISNELQKVTNKMEAMNGKDVNITVIGQGALNPTVYDNVSKTDNQARADETHDAKGIDAQQPGVKQEGDENVSKADNQAKNADETHDGKGIGAQPPAEVKQEGDENVSKTDNQARADETHDAKDVDALAAGKSDIKPEIDHVNELKNLGIVKKQISEFQSIIDGNKGSDVGHNGIIKSDSDTSRYNEIKTELEQAAKNAVEDIPLPPSSPALTSQIDDVKEEIVEKITDVIVPQQQVDDKKVETVVDKEAEKEAAYDRFLEKRRLEREQELRKISGIDDQNNESSSFVLSPPPPAPALDLSKVPGAPLPLKINKKSSTGSDSGALKKIGIVTEMAKRFNDLNKDRSQSEYNGIIKKDSHSSGYDEVKKHLQKQHK